MKDFLELIQSLFEDVLFIPLNALRSLELENWFAANALNWVFMLIASVAFIYWMIQLKKFNEEGTENRDAKAHGFLGKNPEI
ncbi:hypothetical protein SAMN04488096_103243 [Mesonia phycicola]|uniref:Uracil phosphoribosyltransferase n=1 Tax=Mesonia phycicola TaxID=579105 RepID=A0A1M6D0B0_9FLAO|nr:uracil phosphoribosyltransferase [Mesonia phycicola]SHI66745.1 hypothetical protein SAMN04488096_103243 [Mesonia phycicola]